MARHRPLRITYTERPFQRALPRLVITLQFIGAILRALAATVAVLWPYRRELAAATVFCLLWNQVAALLPGWWSLVATVAIITGVMIVGPVRRRVWGWLAAGRTRRLLLAGLAQTRTANPDGRLPRVVKVRPTPIGQRLWLRLRPGQSVELLESRAEELRAALRARDVRLARDPHRSHKVTVDVVRHDTLTAGVVEWADQHRDLLSVWEPVHWGISELGEPVRLSLVERAVLIGGNRGAGKSSGVNVLVAHAAKSPDAALLLIDANKVQLGPWRHRAIAYAEHDPDEAIAVVRTWRDEIDRRLDLFTDLSGIPLTLTREIAVAHGLPMWLLVIDELAYHTTVAGSPVQQKEFYALLRDGVARGRAAGCAAIVATQRPTHDLIPTSLRDLFDIRIAYRTMTRTSSDVILGDDFARRGYTATDIDINARGVAWLLAEGPTPIRTKTAWISPELRAELAVTTAVLRQRQPSPPQHP
jgi:S-DNA-T family DNA segregation ATPase FtsK/SpoIIIE